MNWTILASLAAFVQGFQDAPTAAPSKVVSISFEAAYKKIQIGMKQVEVEQLIGRKADSGVDRILDASDTWSRDGASISVWYRPGKRPLEVLGKSLGTLTIRPSEGPPNGNSAPAGTDAKEPLGVILKDNPESSPTSSGPTEDELRKAVKAFDGVPGQFSNRYEMEKSGVGLIFSPDSVADLKKIPQMPFPFGLRLDVSAVTNDQLSELRRLKKLSLLRVDWTRVTDAGLKHIGQIESLTELSAGRCALTDVGMKEVANNVNLICLSVGSTGISDEGIKEIAKLDKLTSLGVGDTLISDAGLNEIAKLKNLVTLDLTNNRITEKGLRELAKLESLKELFLEDTDVGDAEMKEIAKFKNIKTLWLRGTKVTDRGLDELSNAKSLFVVYLDGSQVTEAGVRQFRERSEASVFSGQVYEYPQGYLNNRRKNAIRE